MSKCSIFVSAISSSIFGGNDRTSAQSTLSVFGCVCVCWHGVSVGGCGGGVGGDCDDDVGAGGGGGSGSGNCGGDGGGGGGDGGGCGDGGGGGGCDGVGGGGKYFDCLLMELPFEVGHLPRFPTLRVGTFWSRIVPVLLY